MNDEPLTSYCLHCGQPGPGDVCPACEEACETCGEPSPEREECASCSTARHVADARTEATTKFLRAWERANEVRT